MYLSIYLLVRFSDLCMYILSYLFILFIYLPKITIYMKNDDKCIYISAAGFIQYCIIIIVTAVLGVGPFSTYPQSAHAASACKANSANQDCAVPFLSQSYRSPIVGSREFRRLVLSANQITPLSWGRVNIVILSLESTWQRELDVFLDLSDFYLNPVLPLHPPV